MLSVKTKSLRLLETGIQKESFQKTKEGIKFQSFSSAGKVAYQASTPHNLAIVAVYE